MKRLTGKKKEADTNFVLLSQSINVTGQFIKTYLHRPIKVLDFLTPAKIKRNFNIASKYFSFLNNTLRAS